MEALNKWLADLSESPAGSLLVFIGVFLARVTVDEWMRKRENRRKHHKHKRAASGN